MKKSLLIIDRESTIKNVVNSELNSNDYEIITVKELDQGINLLHDVKSIDVVLFAYELCKQNFKEIIDEIKQVNDKILVLMFGEANTDELVKCIKGGADDFIELPIRDSKILKKAVEKYFENWPKEQAFQLKEELDVHKSNYQLVGHSKATLDLKKLIYKVAPLDSTVLIMGETGTGKEVVARMIHSLSPQRNHNFIAAHCGGIPDTLLESTLFGHEKGSFTGAYRTHKGYFESAEKGTIFLDEIGDTTPSFQVKLLRVLQEKEFRRIGGTDVLKSNARVIAATNHDLEKLVKENKFREDLYYRLNVITLRVAPLRERRSDIPILIRHFVNIYSKKHNHLGVYLKPATIDILLRQPWRGNVRELENVIERLVALSDSDWIGTSELPPEYLNNLQSEKNTPLELLPYADAKNRFERDYVRNLLKRTNGNVTQAAKLADMPRQNLHLKIKKHGLKAKKEAFKRKDQEIISKN